MKSQHWIDKMLDPRMRAGWLPRTISFFYDLVFLSLLLFIASAITTIWMMATADPPKDIDLLEIRQYFLDHHPQLLLIDQIIKVFIGITYFFFIPLLGNDHRTFGMVAMGISLMNEQGESVTRKEYLLRECLRWVIFPGFIYAFSKEKRALHDRWTKTYVVDN